ncbi:N-acyl-D-amino-acid deacylase family protein [Segniliparus rugosus]|uniref:Amidohydrolase 3 domain-containing protein n=1 Tax=Segniliparus rugosus (strain ATCC BAA-974 / DSM 45345 / CCUG 50838 / CIP 108380 / JCM 13579 / CDC 945) TaxID=679197 RepID=E5XTI4_SEGRC|nr:amidohydrolase family protein [Segniliparus rugosus]EFV12344.1 hypothetical protein HMPREF9336_02806 [Segniliparus rugosus ATCC BAA-974]
MFDIIVKNGLWFDGTGSDPVRADLGVRNGRVAAVSVLPLDEDGCPEVVDATGKWVIPGFVDMHTHYDAEVLLDPGLRESVRHGVTTAVLGCCSMSTVFSTPDDAADLFSRVEAVPRQFVVKALQDQKTWENADGYVKALDSLPLGPNVSSFVGHSDLRAAVMGLGRATNNWVLPTRKELAKMAELLNEALDAGMLGLSGMDTPLDKIDGGEHRSRALPSTYAWWHERFRLISVLRKRGRVLQSAPNAMNPPSALLFFVASSAWLWRKPAVPVSLLMAADSEGAPLAQLAIRGLAWLGNLLFRAKVKFQHLPVPFELYSDGIDLPVFEGFNAGAAALHVKDQIQRNELMSDEEYRKKFRRAGSLMERIPALKKMLYDTEIVECPDQSVIGKSFGQLADERGVNPADAFLDVLVEHGERNVRWRITVANVRSKQLDAMAKDRNLQLGFSDAGAHLRNMAFYNFHLRFLKRMHDRVLEGAPVLSLGEAVHRLTGELGEFFGLDAGFLRLGDRADFVVVNPAGLDDSLAEYHEAEVPFFGGLSRMVRRNDNAVSVTAVGGSIVWRDGEFVPGYGADKQTGRYLRAGAKA